MLFRRREDDLERELRTHLELEAEERMETGLSPREARHAALRAFGNAALLKEEVRSMWSWRWFETLLLALRYECRQLRRTPVFTAVAILTFALGIGANTAIFSVMNGVLMRYLPVREPQRVFYVRAPKRPRGATQSGADTSVTPHIAAQLAATRDVVSDVITFAGLAFDKVAVRYGPEAEEAQAAMTSGNYFSGLGVRAAWGRALQPPDEASHAPVAVLSYAYWRRRFGRDRSVLGKTVYIKDVPFTIVGVAAEGFDGADSSNPEEIWIPLQVRPDIKPWGSAADSPLSLDGSVNWWCLATMIRLAPGVTEEQAVARLKPVFERAAYYGIKRYPKDPPPQFGLVAPRGIQSLHFRYKEPLRVLMAMAALVLLIACVNLGLLLAARNAARQREFSVRMAIGGSRMRIFQQLIAESVSIVTAGCALGWSFAVWGVKALAAWADIGFDLAPDAAVLRFMACIAAVAALVFGLSPLRSALRVPIGDALKVSAPALYRAGGKPRGRQALIALQVCLCLPLIAGAVLLTGTLRNLMEAGLGLHADGLLVFGIRPQFSRTGEERGQFYRALLDRMRAMPGVAGVTLMGSRPGSGWSNNTWVYVDGRKPEGFDQPELRWNNVGPDYFRVLEIPLALGRDFNDGDSATAPKVVVVNQTFVKKYLAGGSPLGHEVSLDPGAKAPRYAIIGVAADSKYTGVREEPMPMAYFPYTQVVSGAAMHVELRTAGDPQSFLPEVRRTMAKFSPGLPLMQPMTQRQQFERSFTQETVMARLALSFGVLAALLVAAGIYGAVSYAAARRTAEVGIRLALGARRAQVVWMVLRENLVVCAIGAVTGIPLAIWGGRLLRSTLFGIGPGDPRVFVLAIAALLAMAAGASAIPARRAASVDPMKALRQE